MVVPQFSRRERSPAPLPCPMPFPAVFADAHVLPTKQDEIQHSPRGHIEKCFKSRGAPTTVTKHIHLAEKQTSRDAFIFSE
jgi:hypothetical protein